MLSTKNLDLTKALNRAVYLALSPIKRLDVLYALWFPIMVSSKYEYIRVYELKSIIISRAKGSSQHC